MFLLQTVIHFFEEGAGSRFFSRGFRIMAAALGLFVLGLAYNLCAFRNFSTQEAMDSAQLARNISEGRGYTTLFIRPLSFQIIRDRSESRADLTKAGQTSDMGRLKGGHPDLANPPVYPAVLAGLMKILPFHYAVDTKHGFWSRVKNPQQREFWRYQPDFIIAVFNQVLFVGVILMTFGLARRIFDREVAWLTAFLLAGSELFWRFSVSGLSTILLMLIFLSLAWCLLRLEQEAREPKGGKARVFIWAGLSGVLVAVGGLTRYSFAWLLIAVLVFIWLFTSKQQRLALAGTALVTFAVLLGPWVARNYMVSGLPFGTATYSVVEGTSMFPEHRLERALEPQVTAWDMF
ncbi:MAG: ArnT family glycosyltransferase, partial [Limisphaerales bacterium]